MAFSPLPKLLGFRKYNFGNNLSIVKHMFVQMPTLKYHYWHIFVHGSELGSIFKFDFKIT